MKIVRVEWVDSCAYNGWHDGECKDYPLAKCISVGILIHKDKEKLTIALSESNLGRYGEIISVPIVSILKVKEVKI